VFAGRLKMGVLNLEKVETLKTLDKKMQLKLSKRQFTKIFIYTARGKILGKQQDHF
jgi:hypothetical protein